MNIYSLIQCPEKQRFYLIFSVILNERVLFILSRGD